MLSILFKSCNELNRNIFLSKDNFPGPLKYITQTIYFLPVYQITLQNFLPCADNKKEKNYKKAGR